jgi:hypothetical protein
MPVHRPSKMFEKRSDDLQQTVSISFSAFQPKARRIV